MFGFWFRYFSTFFRGPGITRWKERAEIGRVEVHAGKAQHLLFVDFPELLEKKHGVTEFLKKFTKFVHEVKEAGDNAFMVLFNELTQDLTEEKEIENILSDLDFHMKRLPQEARNLVKYYMKNEGEIIEREIHKVRKEYWEGSAIINEATKVRGDKEALMGKIRQWLKRKESLKNALERFTWRGEVAGSRRGISETHDTRQQLNRTFGKIAEHYSVGKSRKLTDELHAELEAMCKAVAHMFNESFMVKERAILFILKLMYIAENADEFTRMEVNKSFAPEEQTGEIEDKLAQAVEHLGRDFHDAIEQGFRISLHHLEQEKGKVERIAKA
ncbi:MAG: hypothetical protein Q8R04_06005 [Nanoarchaeota archaeon]|nr:hypothetical protein [Nanoarchaeota archaeon]